MSTAVLLQSGLPLQGGSTTEMLLRLSAQLLGLGIAVATVSGLVALLYRWYVRARVPSGLAVLFGLTVVALYLGSTTALGQVIGGQEDVLELRAVLPNLAAFAVGGVASYAGIRIGDRLGTDLFVTTGGRDIDGDVSEIVQTVGRVTSVRLPEEIEDIVGYDPMPEATKETLENRRFLFPRRLTKDELRDRLVSRLKTDYGVGHVDVELADDGSVTFLAVGSRAAGIGPTLPPSTNALAINADPANAASAGDLVQVWATEPSQRVLTGELRGVVGDVVTVAIDAAETPKLDPTDSYRLVTLPVEDRPDREFASLLRAAEETMETVTVGHRSELDGATVGSVAASVVAITCEGESPQTIPASSQTLDAGDVLYLIGRPETLRRVEAASEGAGEPTAIEPERSDGPDSSSLPTNDAPTPATDGDDGPEADPDQLRPDEPADGEEAAELTVESESGETGVEAPEPDEQASPENEERPETESTADEVDTSAAGPDAATAGEPADEAEAVDLAADATGDAEATVPDDTTTDDGPDVLDDEPVGEDQPTEGADADDQQVEDSGTEDLTDDDTVPDDLTDETVTDDADDVFGPLAEDDEEVDIDEFLSSPDDVEVWDPDGLTDDEDGNRIDELVEADGDETDDRDEGDGDDDRDGGR